MKDKIIEILKEVLKKEERVKFAYLFGSFIKKGNYRDIDIGIYLSPLPDNVFLIISELKYKLSRELIKEGINLKADDIDMIILNLTSFKFLNRIFKEGVLILDKDPDLRTNMIEKNSILFRECLGILKEEKIL